MLPSDLRVERKRDDDSTGQAQGSFLRTETVSHCCRGADVPGAARILKARQKNGAPFLASSPGRRPRPSHRRCGFNLLISFEITIESILPTILDTLKELKPIFDLVVFLSTTRIQAKKDPSPNRLTDERCRSNGNDTRSSDQPRAKRKVVLPNNFPFDIGRQAASGRRCATTWSRATSCRVQSNIEGRKACVSFFRLRQGCKVLSQLRKL